MLAELKKDRNPWFNLLFFVSLMAGICWLGATIYSAAQLPIQRVKIEGAFGHSTESEITEAVMPYVDKFNFFSLEVADLKQRLMQLPWMKDVSVSRQWPDAILIRLTEERAVTHWLSKQLLNSEGEIFDSAGKTVSADLPYLSGPEGQSQLVLKRYNQMDELVQTVGLRIKKLRLSERLAWNLTLDNGMKLKLGRLMPLERLNRFVRAYNPIFGSQGTSAEVIDLRYPNGMAVRWNKEHK